MRKLCLCFAILFALTSFAQNPTPRQPQEVTTLTFNLIDPPQRPGGLSIQQVGAPGPSSLTYYYWVVARFTIGRSNPAGPLGAFNANTTLSVSDYFTIYWQPVAGATGYDVLRTTTANSPSGACTCAVVINTAALTVNDQSNALLGYTVANFDPNSAGLYITNTPVAPGISHLILYNAQNVQVADLSVAGGAGVSTVFGLAGNVFPTIAADTVIGNDTAGLAAPAPVKVSFAMTDGTTIAPIASPTFTGIPAAPTAAPGTNTTQLATTAFVATSTVSGIAMQSSGAPAPTPVGTSTCLGTPSKWIQDATGTYQTQESIDTATTVMGFSTAGFLDVCRPLEFNTTGVAHNISGIPASFPFNGTSFNVYSQFSVSPDRHMATQWRYENAIGDTATYTTGNLNQTYSEMHVYGSPTIQSSFFANARLTMDDYRTGGTPRGGFSVFQATARKVSAYDQSTCASNSPGGLSCYVGFVGNASNLGGGNLTGETYAAFEGNVISSAGATNGVGMVFHAINSSGLKFGTNYMFVSEDIGSGANDYDLFTKGTASSGKVRHQGPVILDQFIDLAETAPPSAPSAASTQRVSASSVTHSLNCITTSGNNCFNGAALGFGPTISGLIATRIHVENAAAGDVDLFTVPANSRAIISITYYNTALSSTSVVEQAKIGGTYFRVSGANNVNTVTASSGSFQALVLEAGEIFSINTSQSGLNVFGVAWVFPNTAPLKTAILTTLASGNNTLYTCPAGKNCMFAYGNNQFFQSGNAPAVFVTNSSGGSLNYTVNIVSSGNTPSTANQAIPTTAVASGTGASAVLSAAFNVALAPGDFINLQTSGAGTQTAWATVYEF